MTKKSEADKNKREAIIQAAMDCFFEKGYDATSVREIMRRAQGEIGLFYYYFESKDKLFDLVLERFFDGYCKDFERIVECVYRDPFRTLTTFFDYIIIETEQFREKYAANLHKTVRWAIREHTLTILVPYLKEILTALVTCGAKPPLSLDVTAVMLAHGVGSLILHEESTWLNDHRREVKRSANLIMGLSFEWADIMFPEAPGSDDIHEIVSLAESLGDFCPGFDRKMFEAQVRDKILRKEVLVIYHQNVVAGCIGYSRETNEINFLSVAPKYRNRGIAHRLMISTMAEFAPQIEVSLYTYCEGDERGIDANRLFRKLGFHPVEQTTALDTQCQRLATTALPCLPSLLSLWNKKHAENTEIKGTVF